MTINIENKCYHCNNYDFENFYCGWMYHEPLPEWINENDGFMAPYEGENCEAFEPMLKLRVFN